MSQRPSALRLRWRALSTALIAVTVGVVACGGDTVEPESSIPPGSGADTPAGAVDELVAAIDAADFAGASRMAVPGQAALAALAEGATFADVAEALGDGDQEVAANFWSGFAQGAGDVLSTNSTTTEDGTLTESDVEFHTITVRPPEGGPRTILVRDEDGFRVDLFASFGVAFADKMIGPVERLLGAQTEHSRTILVELRDIVPSLLVAASLPGTTTEAAQQLFALIEVITRVG